MGVSPIALDLTHELEASQKQPQQSRLRGCFWQLLMLETPPPLASWWRQAEREALSPRWAVDDRCVWQDGQQHSRMVFAGSVIELLALVRRLLFSAGPRRPGAGGKVGTRLNAHTAYRNTRSLEHGW